MKRILLVARHETSLLKIEPWAIILLIVMPSVLAAFFANGVVGGPERSIPGLAALFGFFGLSTIGFAFYRDHGWMTWDRLRVSRARPIEVIAGKLIPLAAVFGAQHVVLLSLGWAVFDMPWRGSIAGGVVMVLAIVVLELSLGLLVAVACTSVNQVNLISSLMALLLAGIGGALAPVSSLPAWVQHLSPVSPVYWALDGFRQVISETGSVTDVLRPAAVLVGMALVTLVLVVIRYDHEEHKAFFA